MDDRLKKITVTSTTGHLPMLAVVVVPQLLGVSSLLFWLAGQL